MYELWFPIVLGGGLDMSFWEWLIRTGPLWYGPVVMIGYALCLGMGSE